jgi:hypothetical protein
MPGSRRCLRRTWRRGMARATCPMLCLGSIHIPPRTAAAAENMPMRGMIEPRTVRSAIKSLAHQNERGTRQVMLTDRAVQLLQARHDDLLIRPRYPVQNRHGCIRRIRGEQLLLDFFTWFNMDSGELREP